MIVPMVAEEYDRSEGKRMVCLMTPKRKRFATKNETIGRLMRVQNLVFPNTLE